VTDNDRVGDRNQALLTDLYQLTMLQAYWVEGMHDEAVFTLFCRRLPPTRNYLVACGLDEVLRYLETLRFTPESLEYLASLGMFQAAFLDWLATFRFNGGVHAVPEGTPIFANEPILEVIAPIAEAQLVETFVMNQILVQTVIASKASRVQTAAGDRVAVDFGLRRTHGAEAGLKAARAGYIAGLAGTSNVLAGQKYGIPLYGTMAHSYVQAHGSEMAAFRAFAGLYPNTTLLVDTYDTLRGVEKVVALKRELGASFSVAAVRLDSGDLYDLAVRTRRLLDLGGATGVRIFASGGLDERAIAGLLARGAPIDGFGVGSDLAVSADAPSLDLAYKLVSYAGAGRVKTSPGKPILPGRKQLFRVETDGHATHDIVARADESQPGRPLLRLVMRGGRRVDPQESIQDARARAARELACLPEAVRRLEAAAPPYLVEVSETLRDYQRQVIGECAET
jgi:nicotinate phosphoribosyltransferase